MLRLLLDEHLSPAMADTIRSMRAEIDVVALAAWEDGTYLGAVDESLLQAARSGGWTLMTFDQRTIVPLLRTWGQAGRDHGGVIFASPRTFAPNDVGGIARALICIWEQFGAEDWTNRVIYLQRELTDM